MADLERQHAEAGNRQPGKNGLGKLQADAETVEAVRAAARSALDDESALSQWVGKPQSCLSPCLR